MSKIQSYDIPCPKCKLPSKQRIYHSINTSIDNAINLLLNDKINFATCPHCSNTFQVKTGLLFNNINRSYAVYYHPLSFDAIDTEVKVTAKMFGSSFYLANPLKFQDWDLFKNAIRKKEGLVKSKVVVKPINIIGSSSWSCDICDGDEETGCLYFDPTECPRHL